MKTKDYWSMNKDEKLKFLTWCDENSFMIDNVTYHEAEDSYSELLDEVYPDCTIAGHSYSTSEALKSTDPTAFRCGFSDYLAEEYVEILDPRGNDEVYISKDDYDNLISDYQEYLESLEEKEEA